MAVDRLERLTNLVTYLLHTPHPVTLAEVVERVPGYPPGRDARRQAFERDKRLLRQERIPVVEESGRYRIRPEDYYLPALELTDEERVALRVAVAAVAVGPGEGRTGLHKLGGAGPGPSPAPEAPVRADLPVPAGLPALHAAVGARRVVRFTYDRDARSVEPWGLLFRSGHWYLVGHDRDRQARRTFRVDRMAGDVEVGPPGAFEAPGPLDPATIPREPWVGAGPPVPGDEEVLAVVRVDPVMARAVTARLGDRASVSDETDGSVVLEVPITNVAVFRSWLLGLLDHAEVLGPPALRADVVSWLAAVAAGGGPR